MANPDLSGLLAAMVEKKVQEVLEPHLDALERLSSFLGVPSTRRGPGRPRGSRNISRRTTAKGRGTGRLAKGDASAFHEGQKVTYRQGRGEFEAKVIKSDVKANLVTVERMTDGKRVVRPAAKLSTAG